MDLSAFRNLFGDLQEYVVGILNQDELIDAMGAKFTSENALDIEYEVKDALAKTGMACVVMTPTATYQGHNGIQQTFTCDELTLQIVENPVVHRPWLKKNSLAHGTGLDVAKAASDRLAGPQGGYFGQFTTKRIQEAEQSGLLVVTATFGCTVYETLSAVPSGDISGHWTEVPFVRMSELSDWIDDYLSAHMPQVDVSGYLPLSGGTMTGPIDIGYNDLSIGGYRITDASAAGLNIYDSATDESYQFGGAESDWSVIRKMDLPPSVEVPTKVSELSNDVGYITDRDVRPVGTERLSGWAYNAWYAGNIYAGVQYAAGAAGYFGLEPLSGDWAVLRYEYNKRASTYGFSPQDWHLSYFNGQYFDPPITLRFGFYYNYSKRIGGRLRIINRGWGWGHNNDYFIGTGNYDYYTFPGDPTPRTFVEGTAVSKAITLSEDGLSVATYDGQTGAITCTRDLSAGAWKVRYIPYVDEVVPYYNTSALTVTVPYDNGFTLQTPNGIPLIRTIDLNRTSINGLSAGSVEVGPDGSLVVYPGAGVDTTKLSAWQWIKTGETGLGGVISSEHNAILGEVSEDFVSFNWLIQQGYVTSADISSLTGAYLPLSGGQMEGGIGWDYGGSGGPQIYGPFSPQHLAFTTTYPPDAEKMVFLDFGRISANGQYTIAYVEDIQAELGQYLPLSGGQMTGGLSAENIYYGQFRCSEDTRGCFVANTFDSNDYAIFPVGSILPDPKILATQGYVDGIVGNISALIHES